MARFLDRYDDASFHLTSLPSGSVLKHDQRSRTETPSPCTMGWCQFGCQVAFWLDSEHRIPRFVVRLTPIRLNCGAIFARTARPLLSQARETLLPELRCHLRRAVAIP